KQLQSKFFYDALGSRLFEAICRLPWYGITRAELALLNRHADLIHSRVRGPTAVVELGCGSGEKLAVVAKAGMRRGNVRQVQLIDISPTALEASTRALLPFRKLSVIGHRATYASGLRRIARRRTDSDATLVLFLGSNIGNLDPPADEEFLRSIRATLRPGDGLLLGADLVKPERDMLLAYDDPLGVTAAFNKNLLVRINRELGGDFDLEGFVHRAVWNAAASRIEMHLVSLRHQRVRIPAAGFDVHFREGERIWTESSYKYEPDRVSSLGARGGFTQWDQWIDTESRFALTLFGVE
ncbi:MAG TPA: L-histidine N(alpha)-methyltransferase, partial [Vicinamibacteria bacterium]